MNRTTPRNLSASVTERLLSHARKVREDYQYVLIRFGLERLMYRLSKSCYAEQFIIKGALLFLVWTGEEYRATKDLDLSGVKTRSAKELKKLFQEICGVPVDDDGLLFLDKTVRVEEIREDKAYGGIRVTMEGRLGRQKIPVQVDIGFGDVVTPEAQKAIFPVLLDFPAPKLPVYPRESMVAEKFETMVTLGIANSRMKDYYDIWVLAREFDFDGETLKKAVEATFHRRKTMLPGSVPTGLSEEFFLDSTKQVQWRAFLHRGKLRVREEDLRTVVWAVRDFVLPPSMAAKETRLFQQVWRRGGPWRPR